MTDLIANLREAEGKATEAPWTRGRGKQIEMPATGEVWALYSTPYSPTQADHMREWANAEFIFLLRNSAKALLDVAEAAKTWVNANGARDDWCMTASEGGSETIDEQALAHRERCDEARDALRVALAELEASG